MTMRRMMGATVAAGILAASGIGLTASTAQAQRNTCSSLWAVWWGDIRRADAAQAAGDIVGADIWWSAVENDSARLEAGGCA